MPVSNQREEIDERILRLLGLEDVFDLDYETYMTLLKEAMVKGRMVNQTIPTEELMLLDEEYKKVKSKRDQGRFEVKKKKISVGSFSIGNIKGIISAAGPERGLLPAAETIAKSPIQKGLDDNITAITNAVVSISETLKQQNKLSEDTAAYDKRKAEQDKRGLAESKLEKRFEGLRKAAEKIISPVKSLLDRILEFFTTVILGRIVYKLVEWLGNPENANKVKSIIRFLGDWGPALLGGFILFGTKFGKGVRILTSIALSGIAKLAKAIPALLRFAKSNPKTAAAVTVGAYAATQLAQRAFSGEEQKVEQRAGGGVITVPKFSGGGFNLSGMFGGMLGGFRNYFNGLVTGEKGVDKIPAWLSDGEFVMSRGAVAKYGVDTLEAMNAAGGGTNRPTFKNESVYAQGGGLIGDIPLASSVGTNPDDNTLRRFARIYRQFGTEEDLFKAFKKLNGVPDFPKMVGGENNYARIFQGHHGADDALDAIRQSAADKIKAVNNPQSFTQSSRAAAGLDDLAKKFDMDAKTAPRYAENLPKLNRPKPNLRGQFTNLKPDYFLRGQFSNLPADYFSKAAKNVRPPIPATSAIVPYTGGGLARTGVTGGLSVPQIRTNMRVPGGFGNLKSLGVELLLNYLVQSGLDYVEAKRLASSIEKARKESPEKLANRIEKLRNIVDREERYQQSFGGIFDKVIKLGGETGSERLSRQAKTILSGLGAKTFQGGKIMGGYGLKDQSFKDAPKTQVMSDDKGKPFIGYKAMRNGKIVYVRGPQPGTGTSNPLEALGRMINPGAYKDVDAENTRKKYDEAAKGSISSLKARGASQATIAKRQAELNKRKPVNPPTKPKPKVVVAGGGMNGRRGSGSRPSTSTRTPNFSATNNSKAKMSILGITI